MTFPLTDSVHFHEGVNSTTPPNAPSEALIRARAEGRRKKEFPAKLALTFPLPTWTTDPEDSYFRQVGRHLVSVALRHLNEKAKKTKLSIFELHALVGDESLGKRVSRQWLSAVMEAEDHQELRELMHGDDTGLTVASLKQRHLGDYLWHYVMENKPSGFLSDYDDVGQSKGFSLATLEKMTENAATFALDVWDADFRKKLSLAGEKGGRASKRPPMHTLEGLEHLSIAEQAKALGMTKRTISRYRAAAEKKALTDKPSEPVEDAPKAEESSDGPYLIPPTSRKKGYSLPGRVHIRHTPRDEWAHFMIQPPESVERALPVDNPAEDLSQWADDLDL